MLSLSVGSVCYHAGMKKTVIYVHGGDSYSRTEDFLTALKTATLRDTLAERPVRWSDTLRADLGEGYEVYQPSMPNKQNARYVEWKIWFERYLALVEDGVVLVGWSLGGMFLAKYLSEESFVPQVKGLFMLAAPGGEYMDPGGGGDDCADFRPKRERLTDLTKRVHHLEVWHSEDDFVVPFTEVAWYESAIPGVTVRRFKDRNHFLVPELPELIEAIKSLPG